MKKFILLCMLSILVILAGCKIGHNFMDVDNPDAKDDLKYYIGNGDIPQIKTKDIIPDSLSGARNDAKGYANQYYEDNLEEYVDVAKQGLSGAVQDLKGYYNDGVDELNKMVTDKVNGAISGELNKFKIK